jgi:carbon-monoxide dehydrogenase small subunit
VLIDGVPARACLTLAGLCAGQHVQTLEGLETDPVIIALRDAFSAEHALQCGYCTPGMLVTARDIVQRLPDADEARIRLELAGNLCRCTGYAGIVKAIRRVLDLRIELHLPDTPPAAPIHAEPAALPPTALITMPHEPRHALAARGGERLSQTVRIGLPATVLWDAIRNPVLIATCVPGAKLDHVDGNTIHGAVVGALGPIRTCFAGTAKLHLDDTTLTGSLEGTGRDAASGTTLSGDVALSVSAESATASRLTITMGYSLRGPLAQFGRRPIVEAFAAELVEQTARTLEARLRGDGGATVVTARPIGAGLMLGALWRLLRRLVSLRT